MCPWSKSWRTSVGYKKPPERTRFKPGQSGNPRGRPKGSRNAANIVAELLNEKVIILEGNKKRRVSKSEAIVHSLVAKAFKGDARVAKMLFEMQQEHQNKPGGFNAIQVKFVHPEKGDQSKR
jgi:hypothetical protein